jgi:hypothetical protein
MIDLTDENDPMLFCATVENGGKIIIQYMELSARIAEKCGERSPTQEDIVTAMRETARTREIAQSVPSHVLVSLFFRMTRAVDSAGNG